MKKKRTAFSLFKILNFLLILLWSYSGSVKLVHHAHTLETLHRQILPKGSIYLLSWLLPAAELLAAVLLSIRSTRFWGTVLSLGLIASFTVYITLIVSGYFPDAPCSCGGLFERLSWRQHLLFNISVLLANILAFCLPGDKPGVPGLVTDRKEVPAS